MEKCEGITWNPAHESLAFHKSHITVQRNNLDKISGFCRNMIVGKVTCVKLVAFIEQEFLSNPEGSSTGLVLAEAGCIRFLKDTNSSLMPGYEKRGGV